MSSNSIGNVFKFHSFGESHGPAMGVVIEGCPSGLNISEKILQAELERRRPGKQIWDSPRKELDKAEIVSGVFKGKSLGTPITVLVFNKDQRSKDYDEIKKQARKGHSEDLWKIKFKHYDHRGGGRSSGRETLARVIAGAFARMLIKKLCPSFKVLAFVRQIEQISLQKHELKQAEQLLKNSKTADSFIARMPHKEKSQKALELLMQAKKENDTLGSLLELWIENLPQGLGQPLFHKFKSDLAQAIMSLGASTALEIGLGKESAKMRGSQFHKTSSHYGGIRGGLTTGERVIIRAVFKPPASMGKVAKKGRFDPCIGPRAVPVLEAIARSVTADHLLWKRLDQL